MHFVTAAFGESHRSAARALTKTLQMHEPGVSLTVFTDLPDTFENAEMTSIDELLAGRESFYNRPGRRNIFKLAIFAEMFRRYPGGPIVWIDADMLVLDRLTPHIDSTRPSVISHGRRDEELVPLGNGLEVPGSKYAISGLLSLPDPSWLDLMNAVIAVRPSWDHRDHNSNLGDQLILNHVLSSIPPDSIHWITDDKRFVFNLEIANAQHPFVGDEGLGSLHMVDGHIYLGERRLVLFYWIKKQLDLHIEDGFTSFQPEVAEFFRSLYFESNSQSLAARLVRRLRGQDSNLQPMD